MLLSGSNSRPQTCWASMGRVSTRPALRMRYSSRAYSRAVRLIRRRPPVTLARGGIEPQIADAQHRDALARPPAQQRAHPREELVEGEWLGEVVVGAEIEAGHLIGEPVARGEQQHRHLDLLLSSGLEDAQAIELGQPDVEDDEVGAGPLDQAFEGGGAVAHHLDRVAFLLEPLPDEARDLPLVLDHQDAHLTSTVPSRR